MMFHAIRPLNEHCVNGIRADEKCIRDLMELARMLAALCFVSSA
jgi:hypothetical protein